MAQVNVHEAQTRLSELLRRVTAGEEIVIDRAGKPVARRVPNRSAHRRLLGSDRGCFEVPGGSDDPVPKGILEAFEP